MKRVVELTPKFVEYIPNELEEGMIYISISFTTAAHKCCCGCGNEVVTPFSPTDWKLIYDGESISLYPSIGNWNFNCKSHYWIRNNRIKWAPKWTQQQINVGRSYDSQAKEKYFNKYDIPCENNDILVEREDVTRKYTIWKKLKKWLL